MKFTTVDYQRDADGNKKYIIDTNQPVQTISLEDFCKESSLSYEDAERAWHDKFDSFYDGWNAICTNENGELYAVAFHNLDTPVIWQKCKAVG